MTKDKPMEPMTERPLGDDQCHCINENHAAGRCANSVYMHRFCWPCQSEGGAIDGFPEPTIESLKSELSLARERIAQLEKPDYQRGAIDWIEDVSVNGVRHDLRVVSTGSLEDCCDASCNGTEYAVIEAPKDTGPRITEETIRQAAEEIIGRFAIGAIRPDIQDGYISAAADILKRHFLRDETER